MMDTRCTALALRPARRSSTGGCFGLLLLPESPTQIPCIIQVPRSDFTNLQVNGLEKHATANFLYSKLKNPIGYINVITKVY